MSRMGDEYARVAHELVDSVISRALNQLIENDLCEESVENYVTSADQKRRSHEGQLQNECCNKEFPDISWPTLDEFSVKLGTEKIDEFVKTWVYGECWLYCIDHIGTDNLQFDIRYRYRVRWSIPTRRQPIPLATASVYFTIDISKVKPKDSVVNVFFVFEGNRLVHRPGQSQFNEKWLYDIIESKLAVISAIDF